MGYGKGMIILDTHIWVWWNQDSPQITNLQKEIIENSRPYGIGISSISMNGNCQISQSRSFSSS